MYEIKIRIKDHWYVDDLIVALVHQGFEVYWDYERENICFTTSDEEVSETK